MTLSEWANKQGMTHPQLAERLGVPVETVRKWLRGERIPRPTSMARISEATGGLVGPADFYQAETAS